MLEINLILIFMIAAAVIAVWLKDLLSSVVAIGAVGIGLCMAFLVLKAPDLAMLQLVVEILSLIILIRATTHKDLPFSASGRWVFNTFSTMLFLVVFLSIAHAALKFLPPFGRPGMKFAAAYLAESVAKYGQSNIVSSIALNYRVLDTLGEATAVFAAVIGVLAIARRIGHSRSKAK